MGPEDHNLFISVTLLSTGEIIYLNRINTNNNHQVRPHHYSTSRGRVEFILDPLGEYPDIKQTHHVGLNRVTESQCKDMRCDFPHRCHFYYTGNEPLGSSFDDINITVFIATDEEEKAWNIPFEVPKVGFKYERFTFMFVEFPERLPYINPHHVDWYWAASKERRVYEPRPPFVASEGHDLKDVGSDDREKGNRKCVIS